MIFTWYATAFDNDVPYRVTLFVAMLSILGLAASVGGIGVEPAATVSFVLAYALMRLLVAGLFLRARRHVPRGSSWDHARLSTGATVTSASSSPSRPQPALRPRAGRRSAALGRLRPWAVLAGGVVLFLAASAFVDRVNEGAANDRVLFVRLAAMAILVAVTALGSLFSPLAFTATVSLVLLA
jgi:low temperature requirement protein LtrA